MKYCERPFNQAYIFPNGDVRACGWTYQKIGNLLESSMEDIWHSPEAEKIRDAIRDGSFSMCNQVACPFCSNDSLDDISEEEFKEKTIASTAPTQFNAAYDYVCNHSCPSCRHEIYKPSDEYIKNIETIKDKLIPYINNSLFLSTDGNGDCFASPTIMKMLSELKPINSDFKLSLETNGVLCDKAHLDKLKHLYQHDISITVTPNSFDRQTFKYLSGGHDNVDKVIQNLYYIKELRKQNIINRFDISIVVQDTNYKELPSFVERCINDFECDQVVIKPIYFWFSLTAEEYWFKDILNPKHPYFNDYMEVLKDPILKHEKVYFWGNADKIHKAKEHPAYNYKIYFDVFANILKHEYPEKVLEEKLLSDNCGNIALYGVNDMSEMMYNLLKRTNLNVIGFIDRDAKVDTFCGLDVINFDKFRADIADTILVSNFAYLTNITRDLRFRNFEGKIIPFNKIL